MSAPYVNANGRDHLVEAKDTASWASTNGPATPGSPDERTVPYLLAGILDALVAIAERLDSGGAS